MALSIDQRKLLIKASLTRDQCIYDLLIPKVLIKIFS